METDAINKDKKSSKVRTFQGPGLRSQNCPEPRHSRHKWRNIRWFVLLFFNFLFFASFFFDIQILEGTLSGSRLLGFHLIDPMAAFQVILSSKIVMINLIIGVVTIVLFYLMFGGRSFCSWICPYHWLAEQGEIIHTILKKKKIFKRLSNYTFDPNIRYYFYIIFLGLAWVTGYTIFEVINPVAIISRCIVYGPTLMLLWVVALLVFEILFSRRAWCRYYCPVGVSYQLIGLLSPLRIKWDKKKCSNCKRCLSVCLVPNVLTPCINRGKAEYVNSSLCTRCGNCVDICDDQALIYKIKYLDKII